MSVLGQRGAYRAESGAQSHVLLISATSPAAARGDGLRQARRQKITDNTCVARFLRPGARQSRQRNT